ncbi:MAG: dCTP deaminase [Acetobacteraceae bacterium]|nr:dCTP deaminase [Acetobacteraceae bacterium]
MDVLGSRALREYITGDCRLVTPVLDWENQLHGCSIDLRLGPEFLLAKRRQLGALDPTSSSFGPLLRQCQERVVVRFGEALTLHPGEFALGSTLEYLNFPSHLMAYVHGRSSWGRMGLIIATAVVVGPGYKGCLTLELANISTVPILVYPGWRVAQLVVHEVEGEGWREAQPATRKYVCPVGPQLSRLDEDQEAGSLRFSRLPIVIGLCGPDQAGKSVAERVLVEKCGLIALPLGRDVRAEIGRRGYPPHPGYFYRVAEQLRDLYGADYLARLALERMAPLAGAPGFVVRGIRHPSEIDRFERHSRFYLIMLDAPPEVRWQRYEAGGGSMFMSEEEFLAIDAAARRQVEKCFERGEALVRDGRGFRLDIRNLHDMQQEVFKIWQSIQAEGYPAAVHREAEGTSRGVPG